MTASAISPSGEARRVTVDPIAFRSATLQESLGPLAAVFHRQIASAGVTTDQAGVVAIAGALLMRATVEGHICLTPEEIAEHAALVGVQLDAAALRAELGNHPWVGNGDGATPLVFEQDRLYLRRFREAEVRLACAIRERVAAEPLPIDPSLAPRFREIFPSGDTIDWQAVAATAGLRSRFSLITGGPGTGKTTTVARLLALLVEQKADVRVALAAPTGKAATRLGEAIRQTWNSMGVDTGIRDRLPSTGQTVHRLLGYRPQDDSFRHNPSDPLEHDVVIIDEASMVPLLLMDTLFAALRPDARIVLLGDHDQLASVEAGSVLADLVAASGAIEGDHGASLASAYEMLSGVVLPASTDATPLRDSVVRLVYSHRFDDSKGIGALARAIRDGDADGAIAVLSEPDDSLVRGPSSVRDESWLDILAEPANAVFASETPESALQALGRVRVLSPTNVGPGGTEALTRRIEERLRRLGHDVTGQYYRGRPLLLTRNDYALGLFNGDIGVVWDETDKDGAEVQRAFIANPDLGATPKGFPLPQLPEAVTAWAMSVHKAQGSEFDTVIVVLPDTDVRVLSRELLYTAVSRAKSRVVVVGPDEALRLAVGRTARRGSGMAGRLI
ncbi:MAG: exodeoxyribonuclease V subunit alpha [Gemmatimonadaceae bacterium]